MSLGNWYSIDSGGINKERDKGQGTLCINYVDHQNLSHLTPHQDYLKALSVGADTNVNFFEEGDYEISLDYTIRRAWLNMKSFLFWDVDIHTLPLRRDYRISFKFSVRNGNCMIFLRDAKTQEELTTYAPNGFYLDLTKSRYLDINVKKEVLEDNSDKLDVRFNKPAKDGDQYTEKGVYTITLKNRYTKEVTTKVISVGDDPILNAYASTLMPIGKIKKHIQNAKNPKNQINIKLKDIPDNMKLKIKVKPYKSDLKPDNSKQQNESVNISLPITNQESISDTKDATNNTDSFQKNDDSDLSQKLASIEKEVRDHLSKDLGDHKIENVEAIYLSQEYIEELQYNSLSNIYFGKSLRELEQQFQEEKYIFTLDKDNKTVVQKLTNQDVDVLGPIIRDVAIGSGVILVATTVSLATGGTATVALVTAAKVGEWAVYGAFIDSALAGIITGIQTRNFDKTVKAMAVAGAEGFKWGAIAGVGIKIVPKVWTNIAQFAGVGAVTASVLGSSAVEAGTTVAKMTSNPKSVVNFIKAGITKDGVSSLTRTGTNSIGKSSAAKDVVSNLTKSEINSKTATTSSITAGKKIWNIGSAFEEKVYKKLKIPKTDRQVTLNGKYGDPGCPRADAVLRENGQLIAVEIKSYDLEKNLEGVIRELKRQVTERAPYCSQQLIILDKRKFSAKTLENARERILKELQDELQKLKISDKKFADISTDVLFKYI